VQYPCQSGIAVPATLRYRSVTAGRPGSLTFGRRARWNRVGAGHRVRPAGIEPATGCLEAAEAATLRCSPRPGSRPARLVTAQHPPAGCITRRRGRPGFSTLTGARPCMGWGGRPQLLAASVLLGRSDCGRILSLILLRLPVGCIVNLRVVRDLLQVHLRAGGADGIDLDVAAAVARENDPLSAGRPVRV
jgi:hypothetical protein